MAPTTPTRLRSSALTTVAVVVLGLLIAACGGGDKEKAAPIQRQSVTAATVTATNLPRVVNASGSVSAWEEVLVGAETGGLVATGVFVDEGTYVRQGQALVQLNDAVLRAQLRQQQAQVQTAEANLARDDAALARAQELKERGFLSQASLDTAQANQRASAAGVAQARAALSQTQTQLNQATVRAPVSGLVIRRSVTRGQIVPAGSELFRIVRDSRLELDAQVPETDLPLVRAGMSAVIVADQGGETAGTVRIVTSEVDPETRLGVARVALTNGTGLRPGMFARARIDVGDAPVLTVPSDSVVFREGRAGVYVIDANSIVKFVPVQTGDRSGNLVAVTAGLGAGQRVVVQGAGFLGEGDAVSVTTANAAAGAPATIPAAGAAR
ncbi:efflux RND transporter periplasmic adaptor subunit [Brevundimonas subvibrioides]|uniref:efflux RND transporter periplasmic adaptor subunit n=1 Tax=Brevundimonas subvibrioides TaxID=74313 RepID=UPI0022B2B96B|nr:efflux RND transporter periplasmic adaptor subunit [Brevundimonas subvibrioides]